MTATHSPGRRAVLAGAFCSLMERPMTTLAAPSSTVALPPELRTEWPQAQLIGQGALRFFGLLVYDARLWAPQRLQAERYEQQPFALELSYARKLDGEAIAERSIAEMRRVAPFGDAQEKRWLATMKLAFPDVGANDRLLGLHNGQGEVRFFHNGRQTAQLADREYARLFFGIWLAPQTSAPALRASLLGLGE
ncbi:MAG: chalcone isomerase family protein [Proteobacteria bacterium]|nr:chalcone isomerase family protein [Pseudomonadota bacterium]